MALTRGALLVRGLSSAQNSAKSHVYPLYSNMRLIKLVDFQPVIAAIIDNELEHARGKLGHYAGKVAYVEDNATAMTQQAGGADANVMFFLLHELPHPLKIQALREAGRMLAPGGKLYLAEFHRPELPILRLLSWTYFKVFEPFGLALWDTHDPVNCLTEMGGWSCERSTYFFGNFQVITATKH